MIYLDNAATTPCLPCAFKAMREAAADWGSIHRGVHGPSERTTNRYEAALATIANFIQADNVTLTTGATDGLNRISRMGWDHAACTMSDHHSNWLPWEKRAKRFTVIGLDEKHRINLDHLKEVKPDLFALPSVSNVLGIPNPVATICDLVHSWGGKVVADATQAIPSMKHFVKNLGVDYLVFSGHKMHGPTGIGVLYSKEPMPPHNYGGGGVNRNLEYTGEGGTPPVLQAIGLAAVCDYWDKVDMHKVSEHIWSLSNYTRERLARKVNLLTDTSCGIISFTCKMHPHDLAGELSERGIAVRGGFQCAFPLHKWLTKGPTTRVSLSYFNTEEDIDELSEAIREILHRAP